jgi:GNAT superfamily N-acetyltransferase
MTTSTALEIQIECSNDYNDQIASWSSLWYEDLEEAGVDQVWVAFVDGEAVGFQTVNGDGRCVAIEVHADFQGKGIAAALVEASGAWKPEYNSHKEFWSKMADLHA